MHWLTVGKRPRARRHKLAKLQDAIVTSFPNGGNLKGDVGGGGLWFYNARVARLPSFLWVEDSFCNAHNVSID